MKKIFTALILLSSTTCTTIQLENFFDPSFLLPIDGLEIKTATSSYMFFVEKQRVFIKEDTASKNSWYHLIKGSSPNKDIVTYQLDGSGPYHNHYIAVLLKTENQQPKASVSIQPTLDFAVNAVSSSTVSLIEGEKKLSSAMYVLYSIPTWVKISRAGIFNPDADITYLNFKNTGNEEVGAGINNVIFNITNIKKPSLTVQTPPPIALTFQSNVSPNIAIYSFAQGSDNILLGVVLDIEHTSPRINILTNNVGRAINEMLLAHFAAELKANTFWEYASEEFVKSSDGLLRPFQGKTWIRTSSQNRYNPISTEFWEFDSGANTAWLERSSPGKTEIEQYLLELTDTQAVYKLLNNSEDSLEPHKYLNKYIFIKSVQETLGEIFIGNSITDVLNMVNNNTGSFTIQSSNDSSLIPLSLTIDSQMATAVRWGNVSGNNIGRSGFVAYESSGKIYVIGGQTNSFQLLSSRPQLPTGSSDQAPTYNDIYEIDNITQPDFSTINFCVVPHKLDRYEVPSFQQSVGAKAPGIQGGSDRLITLGFGSSGIRRLSDISLTTINNSDASGIYELHTHFDSLYHGTFLVHKNYAYTFGGTKSQGALNPAGSAQVFGTYQTNIYRSSLHVNFNTWEHVKGSGAIWEPRTHAKAFSIDNDIILVGGMSQATANTASTPQNDVWISHNDGKTWREINDGTANAPPKQTANNEGPLAGTSYGKLLFLVDKTGNIYYSMDRGYTWHQEGFFSDGALPLGNLYGAQLVAYEGYLYLLGGQTSTDRPANDRIESNMSKKIYRVRFDFN